MLQAILHGKAGRINLNGESQRWRDLFQQYEDLLTAVFFGRFEYLSKQGLQDVLKILLCNVDPSSLGSLRTIRFWPSHFDIPDQYRVETDVILEFSNATMIVEVKLPMNGQRFQQWKNELDGLLTEEHVLVTDRVIFLAIGGIAPDWETDAEKLIMEFSKLRLSVCAVNWDYVRDCLSGLHSTSDDTRDKTIYRDWIEALILYGIGLRERPLDELKAISIPADWRSKLALLPDYRDGIFNSISK